MTPADLLLHPVRLRIVQAFLGNQALTTNALAAELADLPAASLYRQVARLVDSGVLEVVAKRRVRGAVERTYALRLSSASIDLEQATAMTADDYRQAFMTLVADLICDFDRYLALEEIGLPGNEMSYRMAELWLDDAEYTELLRDLASVLQPRLANLPTPGRRRRILRYFLLPRDETS